MSKQHSQLLNQSWCDLGCSVLGALQGVLGELCVRVAHRVHSASTHDSECGHNGDGFDGGRHISFTCEESCVAVAVQVSKNGFGMMKPDVGLDRWGYMGKEIETRDCY